MTCGSVETMKENMATKDEIDALLETVDVLAENPSIIKEIDDALEQYRKGKYYKFEDVFRGKR